MRMCALLASLTQESEGKVDEVMKSVIADCGLARRMTSVHILYCDLEPC